MALAYGLAWDGELTAVRHDPETGAWLFIGVHSTALGPAAGGTRATEYESFEDATTDVTKLASAMTLKMAMAGLPMGGGSRSSPFPARGTRSRRRYGRGCCGCTPRTSTSWPARTGPART